MKRSSGLGGVVSAMRVLVCVAVFAAGLAVAGGSPAAVAQGGPQQTVAQRCFDHHKFGAQPVDVAKTVDGQTVLAQTSWNWHDAIGCYLTLDHDALAILRAAPAPQGLPTAETEASRRCFEHHKFGQRPVDVAKTADRQTVLARLSWGFHDTIGCYLTLDNTALATLQAAAASPPPESAVDVPSPGDREVLAQQAVGTAGATVSHGQVSVSVPAGALGASVEVSIHTPLGEFAGEIGGEVVSVEHQGPVQSPITVTWDVSHLSDFQQQLLLLVRWDEELDDWVLPDVEPDFQIVGGVLTARIQEWSFWTWLSDSVANLGQTAQEILGRRVDAPKCAEGQLHRWVDSTSDPNPSFRDNAIRLCFEKGPGESVLVKMANNRTFGQFVHFSGGDGFATAKPSFPDLSLSGIARWSASGLLTHQPTGRVYIPPLKTVEVTVPRPAGDGSHTIQFYNEQTMWTFILDVVLFVIDLVEPPQIGNGFWEAVLELVFECGAQEVAGWAQTNDLRQQLQIAIDAVRTCFTELLDEGSTLGAKLLEAMIGQALQADEAIGTIRKGARALTKVFKLLKIAEFAGILADLAYQWSTGTLNFFIRGEGRPGLLGQWTPTCTNKQKDSELLSRNLVFQEIFSDKSIAFHDFPTWEPSVALAVTPLKACDPEYRTALAAYTPNQWVIDPEAGSIVVKHILALNTPEPEPEPTPEPTQSVGTYTHIAASARHSCAIATDQTITCWGDNTNGLTDAPGGNFTHLATGRLNSCAIATDQTLACWGYDENGRTDVPDGQYTAIVVSPTNDPRCAISTDSTIACWGPISFTSPLTGQFTAVAIGQYSACAIATDQTIACRGVFGPEGTGAPNGTFTALSAGWHEYCAIATDKTIACWGRNDLRQTDAPKGRYTAVAVSPSHSCAIATDQTITCWGGRNDHAQTDAPKGRYTTIAVTGHSCAIATDRTIACWGDNTYGQTDAPEGTFTAFAMGWFHTCAIRTDQTIACWGRNDYGQTDVPGS